MRHHTTLTHYYCLAASLPRCLAAIATMYPLQQSNYCPNCDQIHCTIASDNAVIQAPEPPTTSSRRHITDGKFGETPYSRPTGNRCMDCGAHLNLPHVSPCHPRTFLFCAECVAPYLEEPLAVKCNHCTTPTSPTRPMVPYVTAKLNGTRGLVIVHDWVVTVQYKWDTNVIEVTLGTCKIPDQTIDVECVVESDDWVNYYIHATPTAPELTCYQQILVDTVDGIKLKPIVPAHQSLKLLHDHSHLPIDGLIYMDSVFAKWKPHRTVDVYLDNPRACNSTFVQYDVKISSINQCPDCHDCHDCHDCNDGRHACLPDVAFYVIGVIVLPSTQIISMLHFHELLYHGTNTTTDTTAPDLFSYIRIRYDRTTPNDLNDWVAIKNAYCECLPAGDPTGKHSGAPTGTHSGAPTGTHSPLPRMPSIKGVQSIFTRHRNDGSRKDASTGQPCGYATTWDLHRRIRDSLFAIYANNRPLTDFGSGQYWDRHHHSSSVYQYDLTNKYDLTQDHRFNHQTDVLFCLNCVHFFSAPGSIEAFIRNILRATTPNARIILTYMHDTSNCTYHDDQSQLQFSVVRVCQEGEPTSRQATVYIHPRRRYCTENIIDLYALMTVFNRYGIELVTRKTYPEFVSSAEFKTVQKTVQKTDCTGKLHPITERFSVLVLQRTVDSIGDDGAGEGLLTPKIHPLLHNTQLDVSFFSLQDLMKWCMTCKTIYQFNMYRKCLPFPGTTNVSRTAIVHHPGLTITSKAKLTRMNQWFGVDCLNESMGDGPPRNIDLGYLMWEAESN